MRRLALTALVLTALTGQSAGLLAQAGWVRLSVELPDKPTAGARLFVQKSCVRCHSLGGEETRVGPDLGRIHLTGTVLDIAGAFWNHAPVMREKMQDLKIPPPTMTSAEMADLVAFLTAYRYYLTEVGAPADPAGGHQVFVAKGCAECHGGQDSWEKLGPSLDRYRGRFSPIFLAQAMWNHSPEMASVMKGRSVPWPKFAGGEMGDLLAYLQAGNGGTSAQRVYFEPGSPRRGRELFAAKRCPTCHAIAGKGGRGGPDLGTRGRELVGSVSGIAGLMWNHTQGMAAEFRRRGLTQVKFSGEEMADIIAYLYFVNYANVRGTPAHGAELFAERCATCHTVSGGAGPNLARLPHLDDPIAIIAAMWNHAPRMEEESRKRGLMWPRFQPGDTADLAAFLLAQRTGAPETKGRPPQEK
jgi:cytochrome c2